ncbi:DEAD/DEAH box helicase family protein [Aerococcus urinaeequi]|uniref:DEAD/DEAH box helicase family protein n=1 Tax=Aerococcus urinaeequi TaxID=51665 RepID=UPI003AB00029
MANKKIIDKELLSFPLIEQAESYVTDIFNNVEHFEVPEYINDNLVHKLRGYQEDAIINYHYTQTKIKPKTQEVLFNMATGSGKTDLMAALILYLYKEHSYQNFLFTVNTNSVLLKTIENLINKNSPKYLFKEKIEIDGQPITILKVDTFTQQLQENTIYIKLDIIQNISDDLNVIRETKMGLNDYQINPVAILADEAHHYSADTKGNGESSDHTWESTLKKITNARNNYENRNVSLEFTATIDFENKSIYEKYLNKIIYRYPLSSFMHEGYSKQVKRIQTNVDDEDKMLNVVLLSQFRKYTAFAEGVSDSFKPVVMFKSSKISISKDANVKFNELIRNLSLSSLVTFIKRQQLLDSNKSSALELAYDFYLEHEDDLPSILRDIRQDFSPKNVLNANDSTGNMLDEDQYQILNSLESPNNHYRVIFAVARLTEGWDVLNLYDIVRIGDGAKASKTSTMVEAQLIGRGARYYPFSINGSRSYKRRFDNDNSNKQLLLETLHYHTMNEPQYLKLLVNSLEQMDLPTGIDDKQPPIQVKVKPGFKKTELFKNGKIYYNKTKEVPDDWYNSLERYGIYHKGEIKGSLKIGTVETAYVDTKSAVETRNVGVPNFDARYIKKAIQRIKFYQFDNLKKYIPTLSSMREFIYDENWLNANDLKLFVEVPKEFDADDIYPEDILDITINILKEYESKIKSGYAKNVGTNEFIGYAIKDYIVDFNKRILTYDTLGTDTHNMQKVGAYEIPEEFFVYDRAIVNKLELELIERIKVYVNDLKKKYDKNVYLFRMDENMHRESAKGDDLKLHQFGSRVNRANELVDRHLQGFQPDFILLLENSEVQFQIFIEPKGMSGELYRSELWKQDLLLYMTDHQAELEFEDLAGKLRIYGLKFYTANNTNGTMEQLMKLTQVSETSNLDYLQNKFQF